jgi:hypothetical protein
VSVDVDLKCATTVKPENTIGKLACITFCTQGSRAEQFRNTEAPLIMKKEKPISHKQRCVAKNHGCFLLLVIYRENGRTLPPPTLFFDVFCGCNDLKLKFTPYFFLSRSLSPYHPSSLE